MSNTCFYVVLGLIFASSGYLVYMNIIRDFQKISHARYWLFFAQHMFLVVYLMWNHRFNLTDIGQKLKALLVFSGINFLAFLGFEIYAIGKDKTQIQFFGQPDRKNIDFANASYIHLYYQYNIYNGVFAIFCLIMLIFYIVHQRNQQRDLKQVIQGLEEQKYQASGTQDPCSICLVQFQKGQQCMKLECTHIFHSDCLLHWLKQHMTCPMCRDNIRDRILNRNNAQEAGQDF